jgi:hypothetical protein
MSQTVEMHEAWQAYEREHDNMPASAMDVIKWAVDRGMLSLPKPTDPREILAGQLARVLRQEYATDKHGRRYRKNHAVAVSKNGVQYTIWSTLEYADHSHMERAFTQRREQIVGDCLQLKTDVDVYNDLRPDRESIQLVIDFTDDVAEREIQLDFA